MFLQKKYIHQKRYYEKPFCCSEKIGDETEKMELPDIFITTYCTLFESNNFRSKTSRGVFYYQA